MKISKSYINPESEYSSLSLEITDKAVAKNYLKSSLDRKCSNSKLPLESFSHRNYGRVNHNFFTVPKHCQIKPDRDSENPLTILQYQLQDRQARQRHLDNLKKNLERRLQTAKAQGNNQLVSLLNQEFKAISS